MVKTPKKVSPKPSKKPDKILWDEDSANEEAEDKARETEAPLRMTSPELPPETPDDADVTEIRRSTRKNRGRNRKYGTDIKKLIFGEEEDEEEMEEAEGNMEVDTSAVKEEQKENVPANIQTSPRKRKGITFKL